MPMNDVERSAALDRISTRLGNEAKKLNEKLKPALAKCGYEIAKWAKYFNRRTSIERIKPERNA